jgi:hypothetical protein
MTETTPRENGAMQQPAMPVQQVARPPQPQPQRVPTAAYLGAINAAMEIAATRLLGLLGVLGALVFFGYAIYDPTNLRLYIASMYAGVVLWPLIYLYLSKGQPG